ncbi:MAG: hypothetical protein AMXMBFR34_05300 [Myxococcaceae bacterium]
MGSRGKLTLLWGLALAACLGCRDPGLTVTASDLSAMPSPLRISPAWVGHSSSTTLELQNRGRAVLDVTLEVDTPFSTPASVQVPAGETLPVAVSVTPEREGLVEAVLRVRWLDAVLEVPVSADAVAVPACPPGACHSASFDAAHGGCVESPLPDGTACGQGDVCLLQGSCVAGACVGQARDCDDRNACTADACSPEAGCLHVELACPSDGDPCHVPVCDAQSGCGTASAVDGTTCGPNDCSTAHVCVAGACVERAAPEGSQCAAPTVCQGAGVCRQGQCAAPPPALLTPVWTYQPPAGHTVTFFGTVDDDGNLYASEHWVQSVSHEVDVPVTALLKLSFQGQVEFREPVVADCPDCEWGLGLVVDSANRRVHFNALGRSRAHSAVDGRQLWERDVTAGLPVYDGLSDGGGSFYTQPPVLLGDDRVGVPVMEGMDDHHAYVQVLERGSGAQAWQFHRKGHLYGLGAAGNGELWTSSANCWAAAGDMARVSSQGQTVASRFIQLIPMIYGRDFGLGYASRTVQRIDPTLATSPVIPSGYYGVRLVTGDRLTSYDRSAGVLSAVELTTSQVHFRFSGVWGTNPDFQLVRDGGVAWTAGLSDGGVLGAVDGTGQLILQCPLSTTVESSTAIIRGRAFVATSTGIAAYDVPGLDVEPSGWVAASGSLERGSRAR